MPRTPEYTLTALGDSAVLLSFEARIDPLINHGVQALALALQQSQYAGLECVPGYHTLTVHFDPMQHDPVILKDLIETQLKTLSQAPDTSRRIVLPVCYDARVAPDLAEWAAHCGLSTDAVIALHSAPEYRVYFLGFKPGFAYLGGLPDALHMPRKQTPRLSVPAGSVGIGGAQTGIYPSSAPGGWQLIGRCPDPLFDVTQSPPSRLQPGDSLQFTPISYRQFLDRGGVP